MASLDDEHDEYEIPLQDQRIFGAGIKRKRVKFVPSSNAITNPLPTSVHGTQSAGDLYLSIVLPREAAENKVDCDDTQEVMPVRSDQVHRCEVCNLSLSLDEKDVVAMIDKDGNPTTSKGRPHEASIAHQVCLDHSHPPSHLDRNRKGLALLSSYGWDPDARVGLGAQGQGIQFPIKAKEKNDKLGIGVVLPKDKDLERMKRVREVKLDAGKVRKMAEKEKRRTEKLREAFYMSEDVERYLGGGR